MNKLITESLGTLILVFVIGNTGLGNEPFAAIAIGSALMVAVYMGGPISGGHYNPAVSVAVWRRGKLGTAQLLPYIAAQIAGAIVAALLVRSIHAGAAAVDDAAVVAKITGTSAGPAAYAIFLAEFLWTFVLATTVLNVATTKKAAGNSYFGLAIGFTVFVGAVAVGRISGGVFNPAVHVGLIVLGAKNFSTIFLFWIAQFLGGFVAAFVFRRMNPDEE